MTLKDLITLLENFPEDLKENPVYIHVWHEESGYEKEYVKGAEETYAGIELNVGDY